MQTFLIVMGSLVTSSLLWIVPLLLLDRNKPDEETADQQRTDETNENNADEEVYADESMEEMDVKSCYAYEIVDKLINVAMANKIVSSEVSSEYAFSIN